MAIFSNLLPMVLVWEGTKFTDDPKDNGGATKYGVTQKTLSAFLGRQASKDEVKNLTVATAEKIYRQNYWDKIWGDKMPNGVGLIMFDGSINHGITRMVGFLQQALGVVTDGNMGQKTMDALLAVEKPFDVILKLSNLRRDLYVHHEDYATYGKGWINRLNDITNKSLAFENKYVIKKPEVIIAEDHTDVPITADTNPAPVVVEHNPTDGLIPAVDDQLSNETFQKLLMMQTTFYSGAMDGIFGAQSKTAMNKVLEQELGSNYLLWNDDRRKVALGQIFATKNGINSGIIDGLYGPQTRQAFKELNYLIATGKNFPKWRDVVDAQEDAARPLPNPAIITPSSTWPLQKDCMTFYGNVGTNQTKIKLPYTMKLAWDLNTSVTSMTCHEKVAPALTRIWNNVLSEYGIEKIEKLNLNLFGGSLNVRKMRGGSSWSMHSWGIAVDMDPIRNTLEMGKDKAEFAHAEYEPYWKIVEAEGAISLGRARNYDFMHFQFARLA
jgi:lysozyme family protein